MANEMRIVLVLLLVLPVFAHSVDLPAELCSANSTRYVEGGCPADLINPLAGGNVTDTTADGSIQCSGSNCVGIVHAYAGLASSGTPSYADVLSGAGALNKQTDAIVAPGTSNFSFINLASGSSIRITYAFEPQGSGYDNRPFDDLEVAPDFPTSGGGGSAASRYVGPGGNDSNSGTSHAQRWLTESKVASEASSLPIGTDVYFLTDGDYDTNTEIVTFWDGNGAGDSVVIDTYCMDGGTTEIPYDAADADCGAKAIISGVNVLGTDTNLVNIKVNDSIKGNVRKWNPGFYMSVANRGHTLQEIKNYFNEISGVDEIVGGLVYFGWKRMEGPVLRGVYGSLGNDSFGIGELEAILDHLHAMDKKLIVRIDDQTGPTSGVLIYPDYVRSGGYEVVSGNGSCTGDVLATWKRWDATIRGYFIDMLNAYGAALDSHPALEAVVVNKESGVGNPTCQAGSGYTTTGYMDALENIALAAKAAFPTTTVTLNLNSIPRGGSQATLDNNLTFAKTNGIAWGGPDLIPECDNDCSGPGPYVYTNPQSPGAYVSLINNSAEGVIPIMYNVEPTEMGNGFGEPSGYTFDAFTDFAHDFLGQTHTSFVRRDFTGDNPQLQWCWDTTGIDMPCTNPAPDLLIKGEIVNDPIMPAGNIACPSTVAAYCYTENTYFNE